MTTPEEQMRATADDRFERIQPRRGGFPLKAALVVLVIAAGLFLLFYPGGDETPPEPVVAEPPPQAQPAAMPALPPAEDIPAPPESVAEVPAAAPAEEAAVPQPAAPPLPEPEDSDPLMREQLQAAGATGALSGFAEGEHLLQRLVALVDGSSRGELLRKILPMHAPQQAFAVENDNGQLVMSPAGYGRYDSYVDSVVALDEADIAASFHQLRPLYEAAYAQLGLPADDLDNAVIRTLDRIIATPEIDGPLALERENVLYTYADPQLEALPGLQKQLLRMGPDNLRRLKDKARALRAALLAQ
jgi:Protein of unknown function (DUF3014)